MESNEYDCHPVLGSGLADRAEILGMPGKDCKAYPDERKDLIREEIRQKLKEENFYDNLMKKLDKCAYRMKKDELMRRIQVENTERNYQECMCREEQQKCKRERQIHQEKNFAQALRTMKDDDVRHSAYLKQLYACAPEIRDLERELRRAYYAKTLHAQRLEGEGLKLEDKMRQQENYDFLMDTLGKYDREEEQKRKAEEMKKHEYYKALKNQLEDSTSKMAKKYNEFMNDKAMIDEVLKTIQEEEIQDLIEKTEKVKLYQSEIQHFFQARDMHREREKERKKAEEAKIKNYLETKEEQVAAFNKAKSERDEAKASIVAKAIERIMLDQFKQEELDELRRELYEEEMAEDVRRKEAEAVAKKCQQMIELKAAAEEARQLRAEKLADEKKEEEDYRKQLMNKFAEDEKLEQLSNSRRRQREIEHRKKVEEMIAERRARKAQEREKEQASRHCFDEETKRRQALIDEERLILLREHGPKLLGFIPRGVIKSQIELENLGEPFLSYYRNQPTEPDPTTIDMEPCEEEIFKTMELPKYAKY